MGHSVAYLQFDYKTSRKDILSNIENYAFNNSNRQENPSGQYHNNFKFEETKEFKTREEASKYLDGLDVYEDRGVIYYEYPEVEPKAKIKRLQENEDKLKQQAIKFANDHSIQKQKSQYISCKNCGSKINKDYLIKNSFGIELDPNKMGEFHLENNPRKYSFKHYHQTCPVCEADLRAEYIQKKLDEYADKVNDIEKQIKESQQQQNEKNFKKAKKMWLCKVEVHN